MEQNKTSKYLKYAIGEITLVVIGILIALQINNWNENRKFYTQEQLILLDLKKELPFVISYNDSTALHYRYILHNFENILSVSPQPQNVLGKMTNWASPYLTYTAYESLKNKGIDTIGNNDLKKEIIALHETEFSM